MEVHFGVSNQCSSQWIAEETESGISECYVLLVGFIFNLLFFKLFPRPAVVVRTHRLPIANRGHNRRGI
jgi:hypothetical protein